MLMDTVFAEQVEPPAQTTPSQCTACRTTGGACETTDAETDSSLWTRDTLSAGWFGLGPRLQDKGVSIGLSLTQIYQQNLRGGLSTHRHAGRYTGSYDLEVEFDLETLIGLRGGSVGMLAEGSWSDGLDDSSIGSLFGVNADAAGDRAGDVTELYYEQWFADKVALRIGKLDLTGGFQCRGCPVAFDGNAYANDETTQFLNAALVNNPTIPFPDRGLGAVLYVQPVEWWYAAVGAADAEADARETGFNTTFRGPAHFLALTETGVTPLLSSPNGELPGAYRIGLWYDPQPKERFDGSGVRHGDVGFYLSLDQLVYKERHDAEDTQGLGLFARYGYADGDVNDIRCFWSAGAQYQGLIPSRDEDVLALGVAQGLLAEAAGYTAAHETALEVYYRAQIAPWLSVTPSVQYVWNPGGQQDVRDAVVAGVRIQMAL